MTEQQIPDGAALATAQWWADRVFGEAAATSGDGMIDLLAVLAGRQGVPADLSKRDQFVAMLAKSVQDTLDRDTAGEWGAHLSVDYGPEGALASIARALNIGGTFPWKTSTSTRRDYVTAALGYSGRPRVIWSAEGWEPPPCGTGKWDEQYREREPWKCGLPRWHESDHEFNVASPLCAGTLHDKPCRRPADDDMHDMDDIWSSAQHHFVEPAEVSS